MSSLITNLRSLLSALLGPTDPRPEPEIQRDLDDEFAFHLAMLERELIESGLPPEVAAAQATARFGNVDHLQEQCRRIALEDRLMMQKINFVLMVIVMLAVIGVSIQVFLTQRYNSLALQDITTQIAKMRIDARLEAREWAGVSDSSEARTPHVMIEGFVENPGWYPIVTDPPTCLHEIVQQARPAAEADIVYYRRSGRAGTKNYAVADLLSKSPERVLVTAGDTIHVDRTGDSTRSRRVSPGGGSVSAGGPSFGRDQSLLPGMWQEVVAEGDAPSERASITIIETDNVRNLRGYPHGILALPQQSIELDLTFINMTSGPEIRILEPEAAEEFDWRPQSFPGGAARGRWAIEEDGTLLLNITPAVPEITEPLRFKRIDIGTDSRSTSALSSPGFVVVEGHVRRPGVYALPGGEPLRIARLLDATGGIENPDSRIVITRRNHIGLPAISLDVPYRKIDLDSEHNVLLRDQDIVAVRLIANGAS